MASPSEVVVVDAAPLQFSFEGAVFSPSNTITHQLVANQLSVKFGPHAIAKGLLPASTKYFITCGEALSVDWVSPGWFSVYEFPFRIGFTLPCSGLVKDFLMDLGVAPCQLMPSVWKAIFAIEAIGAQHGCSLTVADLKYNFMMRTYGVGRYSFRKREGRENLISRLDTGDDRLWYSAYIFIKKDSLGEGCSFIPTELKTNVDSWDSSPEDPGSKARIARFLEVPASERSWPVASVHLAAPFQQDIKNAVPGKSSVAQRTRRIAKPDEFLARVKAEGIKLPMLRRAGKPAEAAVPCPFPSKNPIVIDDSKVYGKPDEVETVIPATRSVEGRNFESILKKKKLVVEGPSKKRKTISISHPPSISFGEIAVEPGHDLLNQYALSNIAESGSSDLAAKLATSIAQSLQCALALGISHKDLQSYSDCNKNFATELEISRKTHELECKRLYDRYEQADAASKRFSIETASVSLDLKKCQVQLEACKEELELAQSELESQRQSQDYLSIYHNMSGRLEILTQPSGKFNLQEELRSFKRLFDGDDTFDEFIIRDACTPDQAMAQSTGVEGQAPAENKSGSNEGNDVPV